MEPYLLAIDPGNHESAWCVIDTETRRPQAFAKQANPVAIAVCEYPYPLYVEMVASYGMAVGREVFDTCVWTGRFIECHATSSPQQERHQVFRRDIKLHHCGQARAKDSNVRQALVDRFAPGQPNHGKGTKAEPGWFYGFHSDIWQAYALAVYAADLLTGEHQ